MYRDHRKTGSQVCLKLREIDMLRSRIHVPVVVLFVLVFTLGIFGCGGGGGSSGRATTTSVLDTNPPSVPTGLVAAAASGALTINLAWTASTDNVAVVDYIVKRNGAQVGTSVTPGYADTGLVAATTYSYTVAARDAAGNVSADSTIASASITTAFPLTISSNQRYLRDQNNVPFPILGRTAWFITSLSETDYRMFIDDTVAKGYNAIEFHVINHDPRGNHPPLNGNLVAPFLVDLGGIPYTNISQVPDFAQPNEAYWSFVDALLAYAESKGVLCFMFPAYVGYDGTGQGWMDEIIANNSGPSPTKLETYGAWVANRYKNQKNIVWMAGGDSMLGATDQNDAEASLLAGLQGVLTEPWHYFSAEWERGTIATDQWKFGSQMTLNGTYADALDINNQGRRAYAASAMPAFLLEEPYDEEGPDGNSVNLHATQPVRRFQWWGWLSNIGGYISGNGYVWPFTSGWQDHLDTQGAKDMAQLNAFIRSIAWHNLVPSDVPGMRPLITAGGGSLTSSDYVAAAATVDGTLLVAYVPPAHSGPITIDMTGMPGPTRARWFDPTTGNYVDDIGGLVTPGTSSSVFTPPSNVHADTVLPDGPDWVLLLEK
jgi:hypothetical protein